MKLQNLNTDKLEMFFDVLGECKGKVYLKGKDMYLNLKSNLAKYVSFASLCASDADEIAEIEIYAEEREDVDRLIKFMVEGNI